MITIYNEGKGKARDALAAEREKVERWRANSRETWEAMTAMRNSINEHIPMPSIEGDLLQGPENSVFCASVAEAVVAKVAALTAERDEALTFLRLARLNGAFDDHPDCADVDALIRAAIDATRD